MEATTLQQYVNTEKVKRTRKTRGKAKRLTQNVRKTGDPVKTKSKRFFK